MTIAARRKGTAFESAVVSFLRDHDVIAERLARAGAEDDGDIICGHVGRYFILEAKATRQIDLAGAVDQAEVEARNYSRHRGPDHLWPGVAVIKRRNHGIAESYVVMSLRSFVGIVRG